MKFNKKLKILENAGVTFKVESREEELVTIDLSKNDLMWWDKSSSAYIQTRVITCEVFTKKELIEIESETLLNCYFNEFENKLNESFNDSVLVGLFVGTEKEKQERAFKIAKKQIDNRFLTMYNCLTYGQKEIIADKLYLRIY